MADHDLAAELAGYRAELAHCEKYEKTERAELVNGEIERVEGEVRGVAESLERAAADHEDAGRDVLAAQARVEARRYRELLDDGEAKPASRPVKRGPGRPRKETAEDKTPREKA
ncbi:hypothetical protein [Actinomadura sp. 9N215]|uniref:hypothetical protein n=1 Tax=Actinomadura sp. 9N215 TaxID=3375150 RepID=UPI00379217FF